MKRNYFSMFRRFGRLGALSVAVASLATVYACSDQKTTTGLRPAPTNPVAAVGVGVGPVDMNDPLNGTATVNGGVWQWPVPFNVGTGQINPFISTQNDGQEECFNSLVNSLDCKRYTNFTHDLPLNHVPTIKENNIKYREFILDANEANSGVEARFAVKKFDLWLCDDLNAPQYDAVTDFESNVHCTKVYDISGHTLYATDEVTSGSGLDVDYRILIPEAAFQAAITTVNAGAATTCLYNGVDSPPCGVYLVLHVIFGGEDGWGTTSTFEEMSTIKRPVPATIEVRKVWVGPGGQTTLKIGTTVGGSEINSTLTGAAGGAPLTTGVEPVDAGTYYVAESGGLTGYSSSVACTDNGSAYTLGTNQSITAVEAHNYVCTFTNTAQGSLAIQKQTIGGTATFSYTVSGTGLSAFTRNTATQGNPTTASAFTLNGTDASGDKYVSETALAGWVLTNISCTANGATIVIGTGQGGSFVAGATSGFDAGDNTVKVTLAPGSTPTCTFVNTAQASLAIQKLTVGGTASFDYTVSGGGLSAFSRNTATQGNPTTTSAISLVGADASGDKYVTETAKAGWTLTNISCTANGAVIAIGTGQGGSFSQGATAGYDQGDNTVKVTVDAGDTPTCTFTNTKDASLAIQKQTVGTAGSFSYTGVGSDIPASFTRNTSTQGNPTTQPAFAIPGSDLGDKYVQETVPAGYKLTNISCTANGATIVIGTGTDGSFAAGSTSGFDNGDNSVKVTVHAGDTPTCTFTNTELATLIIQKIVVGGGSQTFTFTRTGVGVTDLGDNASPTLSDGGSSSSGKKLLPGTYKVCETNLLAGWQDPTATLDGSAITLYNPDDPQALGNYCYNVTLVAGQTSTIVFTNAKPPGTTRTIGYWKNWSSCAQSNGKQYDKALAAGNFDKTLDGNLPQIVGDLNVNTCPIAVSILSKSDIVTGKNMAGDPAYGLASQFLGAKLNISAGAGSCTAADNAIAAAQTLLDAINFIGTGAYKASMTSTQISDALTLAGILGSYNEGTLGGGCPTHAP